MVPLDSQRRPRVEGSREQEILLATLDVLLDEGYDKLTMDAVAARAKASKATLYRRWSSKARLVVDALQSVHPVPELPDTGNLRDDLHGLFCGVGPEEGLVDAEQVALFTSVITTLARDAEFAAEFRERVLEPKRLLSRLLWQRARERGELRDDVDIDLFEAVLPGIVLYRVCVAEELPDAQLVTSIIDQLLLPAVSRHS